MRSSFLAGVVASLSILARTSDVARASSPAGIEDAPPANLPTGEELSELYARFMDRLEPFGFHGAVLAARAGHTLIHRANGLARVTGDVPNGTTTMFSTGSVTKQFAATAILRLDMEGTLSTTDSITPFFEAPSDEAGITIHHLLTHTSGLQPMCGDDNEFIGRDGTLRYESGGNAFIARRQQHRRRACLSFKGRLGDHRDRE